MARQEIQVEANSAAAPKDVWPLLVDVTTWTQWAGFNEASYERKGVPAPHGLGAVRRFRAGFLRSRETVLVFQPDTTFAYDYVGTLPIKEYRSTVTLGRHNGGTRIRWHSVFTPKFPLTGTALRLLLSVVLRTTAKRLAKAAEAASRTPG